MGFFEKNHNLIINIWNGLKLCFRKVLEVADPKYGLKIESAPTCSDERHLLLKFTIN